MKQILLSLLIVLVMSNLNAQDKKVSPAYWVVETNSNNKDFSIVRLYDLQSKLVHEVRMEGFYFDVTRSKHRKMLDQLLKGYYSLNVSTAKTLKRERRRV